MARIRKLLESKYGNENDQTFAYTFSDGFKMRLTPVMMMEWCRNIVRANVHLCTAMLNMWGSMMQLQRSTSLQIQKHLTLYDEEQCLPRLPDKVHHQHQCLHRHVICRTSMASSLRWNGLFLELRAARDSHGLHTLLIVGHVNLQTWLQHHCIVQQPPKPLVPALSHLSMSHQTLLSSSLCSKKAWGEKCT